MGNPELNVSGFFAMKTRKPEENGAMLAQNGINGSGA
jgi:hypothetical protein